MKRRGLDTASLYLAYDLLRRVAFYDMTLPARPVLRSRRKRGCDGFHYPYQDKIDVCPDQTPHKAILTLAHEMVHMALEKHDDLEIRGHGEQFKLTCELVTKRMGWPDKNI
jgi:hypothetical protein